MELKLNFERGIKEKLNNAELSVSSTEVKLSKFFLLLNRNMSIYQISSSNRSNYLARSIGMRYS